MRKTKASIWRRKIRDSQYRHREQGISKAGYAMTQLARLWLWYQYGSGPVVLKNEAACYG